MSPFLRDYPGQLTPITVPLGISQVCQLWRTPEAASWATGHGLGVSDGRGAAPSLTQEADRKPQHQAAGVGNHV